MKKNTLFQKHGYGTITVIPDCYCLGTGGLDGVIDSNDEKYVFVTFYSKIIF